MASTVSNRSSNIGGNINNGYQEKWYEMKRKISMKSM
jgi:hypothetical protein